MDDNTKPIPELTMELPPREPSKPKSSKPIRMRRGYGKKNLRKNKNGSKKEYFSLIGTNSDGINATIESFYSLNNRYLVYIAGFYCHSPTEPQHELGVTRQWVGQITESFL